MQHSLSGLRPLRIAIVVVVLVVFCTEYTKAPGGALATYALGPSLAAVRNNCYRYNTHTSAPELALAATLSKRWAGTWPQQYIIVAYTKMHRISKNTCP